MKQSTPARTCQQDGLLAWIFGAALNSTADQKFNSGAGLGVMPARYVITRVIADQASGTPILAAGGVYSAAAKGGTNYGTGPTQLYTAMTSSGIALPLYLLGAVVGTGLTVETSQQLYFSLTTANAAAVTVNILIYGYDLDATS